SVGLNGLLDRSARQIIRGILVRPDHAGGVPWAVLARQFATRRVARKSAELALGLGLKHKNTHTNPLSVSGRRVKNDRRRMMRTWATGDRCAPIARREKAANQRRGGVQEPDVLGSVVRHPSTSGTCRHSAPR